MNKRLVTLLTLSPLMLASCVVSKYDALMLVTSNKTSTASISFGVFEGQYVFRLKRTEAGEGTIKFTASLEEGHAEVLFKTTSMENYQTMFEINGGETKDDYMGYLEKGWKATIIVKSDGKITNGSFAFDSNYDSNDMRRS